MPSFPAKPRVIAILAFPGALLLDIAGPAQVFATVSEDRVEAGAPPPYAIRTVSLAGGLITTDTGIAIATDPVTAVTDIDTLIVPGGATTVAETENAALTVWLQAAAGRARRTASVCLGTFLLAAAGLLDGRRATTHWQYCGLLAERFPAIRVATDPIFVQDGALWSSAGVTAGIDLALALVEEDEGHATALSTAQSLVMFLKRPGGQAQFSRTLAAQSADSAGEFEALHAWMAENLTADLRVEALAERARMSPRSFARSFAARTGATPARAVESLRVEAARRMLVDDRTIPIARVATRCGFGDEERMRRAFLRVLSVSPSDYRQRFGRLNP